MSNVTEQAERLMAFLNQNREDRGVMANLRRGFSPATEHRAWPHVARLCDLEKPWSRLPVQTVCAAFATHPADTAAGNFGDTLRRIACDQGGADGLASFEARFRRLLACDDQQELCARLPAVVRAAKAKEVPVNYARLYGDICYWGDAVKLRWASSYWGAKGGDHDVSDQN